MKQFALVVLLGFLLSFQFVNPSSAHHPGGDGEEEIFHDLSIEDPYYPAIADLHSRGVLEGDPAGNINGEQPLLRAELVTIVVRGGNITVLTSDKNCFPDVQEQWFAGPVCAMVRLKMIKGYADGFFRPGQNVTAGEAAKIILNALTSLNFIDLQEAIDWLEQNKLYINLVGINDPILRNEAFARLLYVLDEARMLLLDQVDSEGNPFDPDTDTIMVVEDGGPVFYVEYNQQQYEKHLGKSPMVLFFHAKWCPSCRFSEGIIVDNLDKLVGGAILFKVDYDTELELRKTYGITIQDSFIAINKHGEIVERDVAIGTPEEIQAIIYQAVNL